MSRPLLVTSLLVGPFHFHIYAVASPTNAASIITLQKAEPACMVQRGERIIKSP